MVVNTKVWPETSFTKYRASWASCLALADHDPCRDHGTVYQTLCIMHSIICEYDRWTYSDTGFSQYDFHTTKPFRLPCVSVFRTFH